MSSSSLGTEGLILPGPANILTLVVTSTSNFQKITVDNHIVAAVTTPTVSSFSFANPDISATMVSGSRDIAGSISIIGVTGQETTDLIATGDTITVSFGANYSSAPIVILAPGVGTAASWGSCQWCLSAVSTTAFTALATVGSGNIQASAVNLNWMCIGVS